ncbi:MAG: 4-alpha-glucanotransferase [Cyanobacteria bacterium]|nr:4-alpha-glucanotransferase [Cyanobacteria bacterium CG_2015-16_32_12]NCO79051.1 4-alpha-glucanotransferase [Cyanobacteria bacterium CG_2015-22_32_23]NCQ03838.1 4-alpha-glucanotransferase [Cyanobacteria bacterium CG_2015-09_32_10]NCQ40519.1 4-alpha-glucanotransferase [Cyanobacteria bacterium CG_2015-04_32_10]NCS84421.1 4-alpha-glucanotransferase [Cyanobacteria bacterium CG_2015-02_32_10]
MFDRRLSGILLHPTSLPSDYGIGDLGNGAYRFVDFLAKSDQQVWQILPLGPTGAGNSPYLAYSALAGNPLMISLDILYGDGLLTEEDLEIVKTFFQKQTSSRVNFDLVIKEKYPLYRKAFNTFQNKDDQEYKQEFAEFCDDYSYWLEDYALYMALKDYHHGSAWFQWDEAIAKRHPEVISQWQNKLGDEMFYHKFLQFSFFKQWRNLKKYANEKNVKIFGDIPIYVAHDSVDVWANQDNFCLDAKTGAAALMAGVPPDYFSETGQLWGNPVYDWEVLEKNNFAWWIQRIKGMLEYVDIMRIDHFRGFEAYWAVPEGETTAMNGEWLTAPGDKFFTILEQELGVLPIVAEDLGVITPEVEQLRDKYKFPGMKVLHFAFDSDRGNGFLPYNYSDRNCVVYTGTHDNDTTVGWFEKRSFNEKKAVVDFLGGICNEGIHWSLIRLALASVANLAIFPVQDLLGLGSNSKMNTPGTIEDNWSWRYKKDVLTDDISEHLKYLTSLYGRASF